MGDMDFFNDIFAEAFGNFPSGSGLGMQTKFVIVSTIPDQPCIITESTELIINSKKAPNDDESKMDQNKLINIKKLPDLKKLYEVTDLQEIMKLSKAGFIISKYQSKEETIYIGAQHYFIQKKSNKK